MVDKKDNFSDKSDEVESWFYSYEGWANQKRDEAAPTRQREFLESGNTLDQEEPNKISSHYANQSFLTGEADLLEVEQVGQQITLKIYKGGICGAVTRLSLNPKEARTVIMMLATAIEGGPFTDKNDTHFIEGRDF